MAIEQLKAIHISTDQDIVLARHAGRLVAAEFGFEPTEIALIVTVISELARNILLYAKEGEVEFNSACSSDRTGMEIIARDNGPGIEDIAAAMTFGYSTSGSLGMGLPGTKRVMDEFHLETNPGKGCVVRVTKWVNQNLSNSTMG